MGALIYVGGLPPLVTEEQLRELFAPYGAVRSARVMTDESSGTSRGFGFVEMENSEAADIAIAALNHVEVQGCTLSVSEAREGEFPSHGGPIPDRGSRRTGW